MSKRPDCLLLFDIDGTLLLTGGAGARAMLRAGRRLWGERLSWVGVEAAGGLDPALFEEAMERSGIPVSEDDHLRFRALYIGFLEEELGRGRADVIAMPGVRELLDELRTQTDVELGLLTGNYGPAARLKIAAAGLSPEWFEVAAFGDDAPSRPKLVEVAIDRFEARHGVRVDHRRIVVIGDTPRDVHCALENGCMAFAVATGKHAPSVLREAGAHVVVESLIDPSPLRRVIEGFRNSREL